MRYMTDIHAAPRGTNTRRAIPLALAAIGLATAPLAVSAGENPYAKADQTWININGTVETVNPNSFMLDYGDGSILVEMDDGDRDADAYKLVSGDKVSVSGRIDDDFFESTTIEASSVYVENIGTTFFSSAMDEETRYGLEGWVIAPIEVSRTEVRGTVTAVNADDFVIDTGQRKLTVDVGAMAYDPLDNEGYQQIDVGDRVKVVGEMETRLFEGRVLEADTLIELYGSTS